MITLIRDKDPPKASVKAYTSKVLSYNTHTNAGAKGDCLTFYGWVETLRRSAGILFSGEQWDETYPTESDKVRLLLFWIEQGEASDKKKRLGLINTRIQTRYMEIEQRHPVYLKEIINSLSVRQIEWNQTML